MARVVAFRADATPATGAGHVMRCLALAEEVRARGDRPVFVGSARPAWVAAELAGVASVPAPATAHGLAALLAQVRATAVVIDSYALPGAYHAAARTVAPVLAIHDGGYGVAAGDVVLDQNAVAWPDAGAAGAGGPVRLRGCRYALLRDRVRRLRPASAPAGHGGRRARGQGGDPAGPVRVLVVLGGTDAAGAAGDVATALLDTGRPCDVTVVSPTPLRLSTVSGQRVRVRPPAPELVTLAAAADLVVAAAGTLTWELCCLGVPAALLWVVPNQRPVYDGALAVGCAQGLGSLAELRADRASVTARLDALLAEPRRRTALARAGWHAVDGYGRARVLDLLYAAR